jgi:hypothetical protein
VSDLFCAATVLVAPLPGRELDALASRLADRRVAGLYASADLVSDAAVVRLAASLDLPTRPLDGLHRRGVGEGEAQVVGRVRDGLDSLADLYRGESVLVLADARLMELVLPRLAANAGPAAVRGRQLVPGDAAVLERDADGWRLAYWPPEPVRSLEPLEPVEPVEPATRAAAEGAGTSG